MTLVVRLEGVTPAFLLYEFFFLTSWGYCGAVIDTPKGDRYIARLCAGWSPRSLPAQVAELVDALVSGTSGAIRGGSSPLLGTISRQEECDGAHTSASIALNPTPQDDRPDSPMTVGHRRRNPDSGPALHTQSLPTEFETLLAGRLACRLLLTVNFWVPLL